MSRLLLRTASTTALFAAALTLAATAATAGKISNLNSGVWNGGAYTSNATGAFSHCAARKNTQSGISLLFSVSRQRQWSMGFSKGSWKLRRGRAYPVRFQVDNGTVLKAVAKAKTPSLVRIPLPPRAVLFEHFRTGGQLKIIIGAKRMRFSLAGSEQMLPKLIRCAAHFARQDTKDPFTGAGRDPFASQTLSTSRSDTVSGSSFF